MDLKTIGSLSQLQRLAVPYQRLSCVQGPYFWSYYSLRKKSHCFWALLRGVSWQGGEAPAELEPSVASRWPRRPFCTCIP